MIGVSRFADFSEYYSENIIYIYMEIICISLLSMCSLGVGCEIVYIFYKRRAQRRRYTLLSHYDPNMVEGTINSEI